MSKHWDTREVKTYELDKKLNDLEQQGYTIFSLISTKGGFGSEYVLIVYYSVAR